GDGERPRGRVQSVLNDAALPASDVVHDPSGERQQWHDGDGDEQHQVVSEGELPATAREPVRHERLLHTRSRIHDHDTTIGSEEGNDTEELTARPASHTAVPRCTGPLVLLGHRAPLLYACLPSGNPGSRMAAANACVPPTTARSRGLCDLGSRDRRLLP